MSHSAGGTYLFKKYNVFFSLSLLLAYSKMAVFYIVMGHHQRDSCVCRKKEASSLFTKNNFLPFFR